MFIKGEGTAKGIAIISASEENLSFLDALVDEVDVKYFKKGKRPSTEEIKRTVDQDYVFIVMILAKEKNEDKIAAEIGCCWLWITNEKNGIGNVGILLGKKYQNYGIGPYTLEILINYVFKSLNLNKIVTSVYEEDTNSIDTFRALGFRFSNSVKSDRKNPNFIELNLHKTGWIGLRKAMDITLKIKEVLGS